MFDLGIFLKDSRAWKAFSLTPDAVSAPPYPAARHMLLCMFLPYTYLFPWPYN